MPLVQALLSRREAIAQDLQRERGQLEKTEATELPPPVQQPSLDTVTFLGQQLAKLQLTIDNISMTTQTSRKTVAY